MVELVPKCLLVVHHIARCDTFILQDQLSVYPSSGGRNHPSLFNFRRRRFFFGPTPRSDTEERVSTLDTADLLAEFKSLVALVEGLCKRSEPNGNGQVKEIVGLVEGFFYYLLKFFLGCESTNFSSSFNPTTYFTTSNYPKHVSN
ncbi:hypothetical protein Fmac_008263 [Flemingia macrophylla]|uniref:Uncharacterized protein n=1 Tax=Flemingia macrophylla TaxID=520843 RepID=A0ABD1MY36_9FABA